MNDSPTPQDSDYHSFLICDHREKHKVVNLFIDGLPIGQLNEAGFKADPMLAKRNPFPTTEALRIFLISVINKIPDL